MYVYIEFTRTINNVYTMCSIRNQKVQISPHF